MGAAQVKPGHAVELVTRQVDSEKWFDPFCWADHEEHESGQPRYQKGCNLPTVSDIGLCPRHEEEILGRTTHVHWYQHRLGSVYKCACGVTAAYVEKVTV